LLFEVEQRGKGLTERSQWSQLQELTCLSTGQRTADNWGGGNVWISGAVKRVCVLHQAVNSEEITVK